MSEYVHQKAVYKYLETLLESEARPYTLWRELQNPIPREVFRRLKILEPFPKQRPRKPTPYFRPVPQTLNAPAALLSEDEKQQLDAQTRVRDLLTSIMETAQKAAAEAEQKAHLILEASKIRQEKDKLLIREEAFQKAARDIAQSPLRRETTLQPETSSGKKLTVLQRINKGIKEQTISKPSPVEFSKAKSTSAIPRRKPYQRISQDKKKEKQLAKKLAKAGLKTSSSDEDQILRSPV